MGPAQSCRVSLTLALILLVAIITDARTSAGPESKNCIKVNNDASKIICVCDEQFCDKLTFEWPKSPGDAYHVETTQSGYRFRTTNLDGQPGGGSKSESSIGGADVILKVRLEARRQVMLGWGGALTDAATMNIKQLHPKLTEELLQSYYGPDGLSYNFGRVPIAGSDFSVRPYSYDDSNQPDYNLTEWSLADEDVRYKIPIIHRAMEIVNSTGESLKLFGSPWSPPKWMKSNDDVTRGYLIDEDRVYKSYANYLVNFFEAYRANGIKFWGATVQNEPVSANSPAYYFNSLQLGSSQAIKFISEYLGPALEAKNYTKSNFKLMVGDDNLGLINMQVPKIMKDAGVQKYVSGLAFHWYMSGTLAPYDSLTKVVDAIRDHIQFVLMTEACSGFMPGSTHVDLGSWDRGEAYASDIMEDMKRETSGWIDWNLALDEQGGPNWVNNFVDSPIIVNKNGNKFYKQPMYYALGHFSRFFRPGSVYTDNDLIGQSDGLLSVAAQKQDTGHLVVNILNKAKSAKSISLVAEENGDVKQIREHITLQPRSINTIVLKL